ncbi:T7SS effector LXG polymorphic toxin [Oceanobacillus iheyensis]|uniref:T7SS effector LXG polymorphic toxin n=1 Tax=Oceanobacillus iheyensis TaxID=182710 RepID=UPI003628FA22
MKKHKKVCFFCLGETATVFLATNAKNYFNDLHKTILITFEHLFTDLNDSLKKHLEMFQSRVDTSESAIIVSNYVKDLEIDNKIQ